MLKKGYFMFFISGMFICICIIFVYPAYLGTSLLQVVNFTKQETTVLQSSALCILNTSYQISSNATHVLSDRKVIGTLKQNLLFLTDQLRIHSGKQLWAESSMDTVTKSVDLLDSILNPSQKTQVESTVTGLPDICPDRFVHANLSEPYFLNGSWVKVNCSKEQKIQDILTVLLFPTQTKYRCGDKTNALIKQIQSLYPGISIIVASDSTMCKVDNKQVKLVDIKTEPFLGLKINIRNKPSGKVWNELVNLSETKYVLLGRGLDHFSWLTQVERQVAVLSDVRSRLDVVGGSVRNQTGHWEVGCYQSELKFYQLIYTDGYYKSKNECMICDYLTAPFIARKSLFERFTFNDKMTESVVFDEFFLHLKQTETIMACPDAMYFATDDRRREDNRQVWLPLVKKLELNRVVLPDGIRHKFTCEESGSSCVNLYNRASVRYMPICCMDLAMKGFKAFHEYCIQNNMSYYVYGGTALGAAKFRSIIPWDFEGDIVFYNANESFFEKNKKPFGTASDAPYFGNWHQKWFGYFRIITGNFFVDMIGMNDTAIEHTGMTELFTKIPTKVRLRGEWLYGPPSPGLYARSQYGTELYKHANSWVTEGHLWFDPYKVRQSFRKCRNPGAHYCYDNYPTDGSIDFVVP